MKKRFYKAITILEVAIALGISAMAMAGIAQLMTNAAQKAHNNATAQRLLLIAEAAHGYIETKAMDIKAAATSGIVTIPVAKTSSQGRQPAGTSGFPSLQEAGFLPSAFIDQSSNGQAHALLARVSPGGTIEAIVIAYGGAPLSDAALSSITSSVGISGGAVYHELTETPVTDIVGAYGGWTYPIETWRGNVDGMVVGPQAGYPMVYLNMLEAGASTISNDGQFLSRVQTASPSDTAMSTTLNMSTNTISQVGSIHSQRYCDETGANCVTASEMRGRKMSEFLRSRWSTSPLSSPPPGLHEWPEELICTGTGSEAGIYKLVEGISTYDVYAKGWRVATYALYDFVLGGRVRNGKGAELNTRIYFFGDGSVDLTGNPKKYCGGTPYNWLQQVCAAGRCVW